MHETRDWHAGARQLSWTALEATVTGLSKAEAAKRLVRFGPNALPASAGRHPLLRFLAHFNSALIYFLFAAAAAALVLGHAVDAGVILAVVLVNAIVGFVQEGRAERALEAIGQLIAPSATVLRDGVRTRVAVDALVPGDVVMLEPGDRVPADLRLIRARGLLIDEALLTGGGVSQPVGCDTHSRAIVFGAFEKVRNLDQIVRSAFRFSMLKLKV